MISSNDAHFIDEQLIKEALASPLFQDTTKIKPIPIGSSAKFPIGEYVVFDNTSESFKFTKNIVNRIPFPTSNPLKVALRNEISWMGVITQSMYEPGHCDSMKILGVQDSSPFHYTVDEIYPGFGETLIVEESWLKKAAPSSRVTSYENLMTACESTSFHMREKEGFIAILSSWDQALYDAMLIKIKQLDPTGESPSAIDLAMPRPSHLMRFHYQFQNQ
ncbi:MAG TPA: hypothetical protein V6D29_04010 [Leptolyngbyaceae cyanobacterium]